MTDHSTTDMTMGVYRRVYSGFVTSKRFSALSLDAADTFWRLNAIADDYGNLNGEPVLVRAYAMPYRNWTDEKILAVLKELQTAVLIFTYAHNHEAYIHIVDFEKRQPGGKNGKRIQRYPMHPDESGGIQVNPGESKIIQIDPVLRDHSETTTKTTTDHPPTPQGGRAGGKSIIAVLTRMKLPTAHRQTIAAMPGVTAAHLVALWHDLSQPEARCRSVPRVLASRLQDGGIDDVPSLSPKALSDAVEAGIVLQINGRDVTGRKVTYNATGVKVDGELAADADSLARWEVELA